MNSEEVKIKARLEEVLQSMFCTSPIVVSNFQTLDLDLLCVLGMDPGIDDSGTFGRCFAVEFEHGPHLAYDRNRFGDHDRRRLGVKARFHDHRTAWAGGRDHVGQTVRIGA